MYVGGQNLHAQMGYSELKSILDESNFKYPTASDAAKQDNPYKASRQTNNPQAQQNIPKDTRPVATSLEKDYNARVSRVLGEKFEELNENRFNQFGYDRIHLATSEKSRTNNADVELSYGALSDDYILGVGDQVVVYGRGVSELELREYVDREGRLIFEKLPPISAAGRTLGDVKNDLMYHIEKAYPNTEFFTSIGSIRQVNITFLGAVKNPGTVQLSGLSTFVDALIKVGGIQKTGTLRKITFIRNGEQKQIDLYGLLLAQGNFKDFTLAEGDQFIVGNLTRTIAVAGDVVQRGIFEIKGQKASVADALHFAGAPLRANGTDYFVLTTSSDGADKLIPVGNLHKTYLRAGDVLIVKNKNKAVAGVLEVEGHVNVPGVFPAAQFPTLRDVIAQPSFFKDDPYLLSGLLMRVDPRTRSRYIEVVDLSAVLAGEKNIPLRADDRLIVLSQPDVTFLKSSNVQSILSPGDFDRYFDNRREEKQRVVADENGRLIPVADDNEDDKFKDKWDCKSLNYLIDITKQGVGSRFQVVSLSSDRANDLDYIKFETCPEIYEKFPEILPVVLDHAALLQGVVSRPGIYPVADQSRLSDLIVLAGGLPYGAKTSGTEISYAHKGTVTRVTAGETPLDQILINPGTVVRFPGEDNAWVDKPIQLTGAVKNPGKYKIYQGERLSEVIARAGGLDYSAYTYGTVFTRESVRKEEKAIYEKTAKDLESAYTGVITSGRAAFSGNSETILASIHELIDSIRNAEPVGRIVIESDPNVLLSHPEQDVVLQPGDSIHIPVRPSHVSVGGEVLHASAQQFVSGMTVADYIAKAGGYKTTADEGKVFLILPNGEARSVRTGAWSTDRTPVPPGSSILVPIDPKPFDALVFSSSIFDVISKVALSAASLKVISDK
jgi:protein involved in polysaccharide export with SLBB domain